MIFNSYRFGVLWRITFTSLSGSLGIYFLFEKNYFYSIIFFILFSIFFFLHYLFLKNRFQPIYDFFEAVKYRDFSRMYVTQGKSEEIQKLYTGFNLVHRTIREMDSERETQFIYLQKILEMIDIGIIAYNVTNGEVIWMNEAFKNVIDCPSFKNIKFLESRNKELYYQLFDTYHVEPTAIDLPLKNDLLKALISSSLFNVDKESFRLMMVNNIENTLNKNESDAWKKLLSVMTHEIMNSIAPINSLASTLKKNIRDYNNIKATADFEDLEKGLSIIENRSKGLMKFAKTYRSLNKVTQLNIEKITLDSFFKDIELLMKSSLQNVELTFNVNEKYLELEADPYLLEQVVINLILNAIDASKSNPTPKVNVRASKNTEGVVTIQIADNGPGIPREILDQVFVPFFTTKKNGSGIGLSLCKQIMTLHGGKIKIIPNDLVGTVVNLSF